MKIQRYKFSLIFFFLIRNFERDQLHFLSVILCLIPEEISSILDKV